MNKAELHEAKEMSWVYTKATEVLSFIVKAKVRRANVYECARYIGGFYMWVMFSTDCEFIGYYEP